MPEVQVAARNLTFTEFTFWWAKLEWEQVNKTNSVRNKKGYL